MESLGIAGGIGVPVLSHCASLGIFDKLESETEGITHVPTDFVDDDRKMSVILGKTSVPPRPVTIPLYSLHTNPPIILTAITDKVLSSKEGITPPKDMYLVRRTLPRHKRELHQCSA